MTKTIPFGEHNLTPSQVNKMGKALWNDPAGLPDIEWNRLSDRERESFIHEFVLTIPKTLGVIGLKVAGK